MTLKHKEQNYGSIDDRYRRCLYLFWIVKLEAMKQKFGNNTGIFIHKVAYTFLPLVFGVIITFAGIKGISLR